MTDKTLTQLNLFETQIGNTPVRLVRADIAAQNTDGYIIPHRTDRVSEWDVALAIKTAFGPESVEAYAKYLKVANGSLDFTHIVCQRDAARGKWFLNAATVSSGPDRAFNVINQTVANALYFAGNNGLRSLASPALGTGTHGELSDEQSARSIFNAVHNVDQRRKNQEPVAVTVALWEWGATEKFTAFKHVLQSGSYRDIRPERGTRPFDPARYAYDLHKKKRGDVVIVMGGEETVMPTRSSKVVPFKRPKPGDDPA